MNIQALNVNSFVCVFLFVAKFELHCVRRCQPQANKVTLERNEIFHIASCAFKNEEENIGDKPAILHIDSLGLELMVGSANSDSVHHLADKSISVVAFHPCRTHTPPGTIEVPNKECFF